MARASRVLPRRACRAQRHSPDGRAFTGFVLVAYALFLGARAFIKVLNIVHSLVWDVPRTKLLSANRATFAFLGFVTFALSLSYLIQVLRARSVPRRT